MEIRFDEQVAARELNLYKTELNAKPDLPAKAFDTEHTLVLVVDMINGFCNTGALASPRCNDITAPIVSALTLLPKAKKIFVRDCHGENAGEFKWFPKHCADDKESALIKELQLFAGIDLPKNSTNGFFALNQKIKDLSSFTNIVVIGVCTDICVMQLALTLRAYLNENNSNANVVTFTDYVETYDAPWHNAELSNLFALKFMEQAGVQIFKKLV